MADIQSARTSKPIEILIVGAGIGGLALASLLLLAQLDQPSGPRFKITVLERSPSMRGLGQNIDIRSGGKKLLHKLGIDDEVRAALTGEEGARFIDTTGRPWFSFAADKTGKVETATGELEILRGRLAELLFNRCNVLDKEVQSIGREGVDFIFGDYLDSIQQPNESTNSGAQVRVSFANSKERRAFDMVVGADGLQSRTRNMAFTERREETIVDDRFTTSINESLRCRTPYNPSAKDIVSESTSVSTRNGQSTDTDQYLRPLDVYNAFFSIPASLLSDVNSQHPQTGDQFADGWRLWYHAPGRKSVMVRPADNKTRLTVLMIILDPDHRDPRFQDVAILGDDRKTAVLKQKQLMSEYYHDAGWECAKLVEGMRNADDFYYDLVAQVKMDKWSRGRVCLLGDAAHCASPFSGMGTTLALVGAYNLAGALTKHTTEGSKQPSDFASVFSDYESATRPLVTKAQKLPPGMPWLIHPQTSWGLWFMRSLLGWIQFCELDTLLAKLASRGKDTSSEESKDKLTDWDKR